MEKEKKAPIKMYFGPDVELAIVEYNKSYDERLYRDIIHGALQTLVDNVFHNMKFYEYGADVDRNTVKNDCVVYLYERLKGFTPGKSKAFSYFNRITINWVLARSKTNQHHKISKCPITSIDDSRDVDDEERSFENRTNLTEFMDLWCQWAVRNIEILFPRLKERRVANAIIDILRNREHIDNFNKKYVFWMVREQVDCKTQSITTVLKKIGPLRKVMYQDYLTNGEFISWMKYTKEVRHG